MKRTISGFTVVELLIVIIVIAILATISIVAYNGIQARAENNKTISAVEAYVKAIQLYAIDNGQYPSTNTWPCIGDYGGVSGIVCGAIVDTVGSTCNYSGGAAVSSAFDAAVAQYLGKKPLISLQQTECDGDVYIGAFINRNDANPKALNILMFLKGDVVCPIVVGIQSTSRAQAGTTTRCIVNMPLLP